LENEFIPTTFEEWKEKVTADLKGADFDKKLLTPTNEGITLKPLYTKGDIKELPFVNSLPGEKVFARASSASGYLRNPWLIAQSGSPASPDEFNETVKKDLQSGLTAVILPVDKNTMFGCLSEEIQNQSADEPGHSILNYEHLNRALIGIDLEKYPLYIEAEFSSHTIMRNLITYLKRQNYNLENISGGITSDPLGFLAEYGKPPEKFGNLYSVLADTVKFAGDVCPRFKTIGVSAYHYSENGASAVQEIAFVLAASVEYFEALTEMGIEAQTIASQIKFKFGIGSFYFMEIAKLRAFRMLWSLVSRQYGADGRAFVHAKTALCNHTESDPHVNMLRNATEAFSAILGGIDILETNSFDETFGKPSELGRRIARNTQIILKEEAHLDELIDPAGGSFYIETLTNEIAGKSWNLFKSIQKQGGMLRALENGFIENEILSVNARKADH